jgi:hypothetical protein
VTVTVACAAPVPGETLHQHRRNLCLARLDERAGRVPADDLWAELEARPGAVRARDALGPGTLEEVVLEGTMAAHQYRLAATRITA